jgi:hypothetical protein
LGIKLGRVFLCRGIVVNQDDEYRRYAREALDLADHSLNDKDRASWLQIARKWLNLLPKREPTLEEQFDDRAKTRGTGHEGSESSH